jgi:drug/metabolite transporter (DMT)-like permease
LQRFEEALNPPYHPVKEPLSIHINMSMRYDSPEKRNLAFSWFILIGLALTWGSSFILIKRGLEYFSSAEVGALRISITFLVLSPIALARIRKIAKRDWKYFILVGIIGSGFPAFLFAKAQTGIDSSLAGILNSLTPLFTMIIGLSFFSLKTKWFNVAGVLIGLAGAIGLISISGGRSFEFNFQYSAYIIVATVCYAVNVNVVKYWLKDTDALTITAFSFFTIGFPILVYLLFFTGFLHKISSTPEALKGLGYVSILSVVGTAIALIAFNKLVKITSPVFASSVTYLVPIIAVSWGAIDAEKMQAQSFLWMAVILLGIFLVNKKRLIPGINSEK